jgi:hypothetical protein
MAGRESASMLMMWTTTSPLSNREEVSPNRPLKIRIRTIEASQGREEGRKT